MRRALLDFYGDTDGDGKISHQEENDFYFNKLFKDKPVVFQKGQLPKYEFGQDIPVNTLIQWVKEYRPEKNHDDMKAAQREDDRKK